MDFSTDRRSVVRSEWDQLTLVLMNRLRCEKDQSTAMDGSLFQAGR
jgi:hypothetical protein